MNVTVRIPLSPERVFGGLLAVVLLVHLASAAVVYAKYSLGHDYLLGLTPRLWVSGEANVPTWFSSATLLLAALLLFLISIAQQDRGAPYIRHWQALALVFVYLSLDETAILHEWSTELLQRSLGYTRSLEPTWLALALLAVGILAFCYWRFLAHLPARTRRLFLAAAALYVGGAAGMEVVHLRYMSIHGVESVIAAMMQSFEELCEMLGVVIFIYALMSYLDREVGLAPPRQ